MAGRAAHLAPQHDEAADGRREGARAINHAVDKEAFLATVYKGIALKAFAPLTAAMLDDPALRQSYPFDPAKAKALLGEAGWQPGADGIRTKGGARSRSC